MKLISPSILSADFTCLGEQLTVLLSEGMEYVHVDVMDGHFVPNITIGPMVCEAVKRAVPHVKMDVHLMIENPGDSIEAFAKTDPEIIYVHVEAERHLDRLVHQIQQRGIRAGVVLNPATPLSLLDEILPAIRQAQKIGIFASGPFPADTVFISAIKGDYDLVIAQYHDQGLIPVKLNSFETSVNITLGIPIVRTSVDHGTAFDIAGQGKANHENILCAINYAVRLCENSVIPD